LCNSVLYRDVNFREFYFSIREFQISRLVVYSKLTRHSVWTTHLMRECCNSVDITPRRCGWVAAPGKCSDGWEARCKITKRACISHVLVSCSEPTRFTDSQLTRRPPAGGFAYGPSLNDRRSSCLSHFSTARNSMLDTEKFF